MTRSTFLAAALLGLAPAILPAGAAAQSPEGPISYEEQLAQVEGVCEGRVLQLGQAVGSFEVAPAKQP